jgi:hypothetical protein
MIRQGRWVRTMFSLLVVAGTAIAGMPAQAMKPTRLGAGWPSARQGGVMTLEARAGEESPRMPLMFVENVGQFVGAPTPCFQMRGAPEGIVWLTEEAIWLTLVEAPLPSSSRGCGLGESGLRRGVHLKFTFVGANPRPQIQPFDRLETKLSYFQGKGPHFWHSAVPAWGGVRYVDLYHGVDLEVTGKDGRWAWRLVVRTLSPSQEEGWGEGIRLRVEGAEGLRIDAEGQIEIATDLGLIHQVLPEVGMSGTQAPWKEGWNLGQPIISGTEVLFPYKPHQVMGLDSLLRDDPGDLVYSTFLGGGGTDQGCALAVDPADGSVIVSGVAFSPDFPAMPGAFDPTHNGDYDAFLTRLSADGSVLLCSTFLGGGRGDGSRAVAVDPRDGTIIVAGATESSDFSTTPGAFDPAHNGDWDAFVARLSADGSALLYSTFLGGSGVDKGWGIALHPADGTAIVVGRTKSSDFPATPGAFDSTHNGDWDAFVSRLGGDGGALLYSTFLGGSGVDYGEAVAVDPADGTAIFAGGSFSSDFPTTPGAFDPTHNGLGDAIVVRLEEDGSGLLYSTFVGGSHHDEGHSVALDSSDGTAVIAGGTMSFDFPITSDAFDATFNGGLYDAFVARLSGNGSALLHSTFLGGAGDDYGAVVAIDPRSGGATVTGPTTSPDFPTTSGAFASLYNGGASDTFVARLSADSRALLYSTFLGGELAEWSWGLAADPVSSVGAAIVTGHTYSPDFPTTPGAFEPVYCGAGDAFVAKLVTASPTVHVQAISMLGRPMGVYYLVLSFVRIVDQDQAPVSGATVEAILSRPDGSAVSKSATTNASGRAVFWIAGDTGGRWTTCVEDVMAAGYVYEPTQNEERCDSIIYP